MIIEGLLSLTVEDDNNKHNPHLLRVFGKVLRCVGNIILTFPKPNVKKNKHGKEDANAKTTRCTPASDDATPTGLFHQRQLACPSHQVQPRNGAEEDCRAEVSDGGRLDCY